jgi:hypothetical protein
MLKELNLFIFMHFKINKITDSVIHKQYWHFIECEDEILTHQDKCGNTIFHKLNKNEIKNKRFTSRLHFYNA